MIISSTGFQGRFTDLNTDRDCPRALAETFLRWDSRRRWDVRLRLPLVASHTHSPPTVPFPTLSPHTRPYSSHHALPSSPTTTPSPNLPPPPPPCSRLRCLQEPPKSRLRKGSTAAQDSSETRQTSGQTKLQLHTSRTVLWKIRVFFYFRCYYK